LLNNVNKYNDVNYSGIIMNVILLVIGMILSSV